MVVASSLINDLTLLRQFQLHSTDHDQQALVEIIGLEMLRDSIPDDCLDDISLSEDSCDDSGSFANDSLDLAKETNGRRRNRRSSNDSFANDSVEIAKKNRIRRQNEGPKDRIPVDVVEMFPPIVLKKGQLNVKDMISPTMISSPDILTMKTVRISNSAA
jgi:hypothetical protein